MERLDERRLVLVVAESPAQFPDAVGEDLLTDREIAPDRGEHFVAGTKIAGMGGQIDQHVHRPRLEAHGPVRAEQLACLRPDPEPANSQLASTCHRNNSPRPPYLTPPTV